MASRQEVINATLDRLTNNTGSDVSGAVIVGTDGIVIVSRMASEINADRVGAVAATMIGVNKRIAIEMRIGATQEAIIKADHGLFLVFPVGEEYLLAINLREGANLGLARLEAREAVAAVAQVL